MELPRPALCAYADRMAIDHHRAAVFGSHTRDELRQAYADAWRKHRDRTPLSPLEAMLADVIGLHPEYHRLITDHKSAPAMPPSAAPETENPFLHMGLHMAVREQVAIDRPPGIRELQQRLQARLGDLHDAQHSLMESLAETLWEAQRAGREPDEVQYLALARRSLEQG